jgi:hypothetical protein
MERRKFPRLALQLSASYSGKGVKGTALATMLSSAGCMLKNVQTPDVPSYLELTIAFPGHTVSLEAGVAIRWTSCEMLGVEFLMLGKVEQQVWQHFIFAQQRLVSLDGEYRRLTRLSGR